MWPCRAPDGRVETCVSCVAKPLADLAQMMPCRPTAQAYAAAAERLECEFVLAEAAVVNAQVLLEHARGARLAAQDKLDVVRSR